MATLPDRMICFIKSAESFLREISRSKATPALLKLNQVVKIVAGGVSCYHTTTSGRLPWKWVIEPNSNLLNGPQSWYWKTGNIRSVGNICFSEPLKYFETLGKNKSWTCVDYYWLRRLFRVLPCSVFKTRNLWRFVGRHNYEHKSKSRRNDQHGLQSTSF